MRFFSCDIIYTMKNNYYMPVRLGLHCYFRQKWLGFKNVKNAL